jgi:hypothetical protein
MSVQALQVKPELDYVLATMNYLDASEAKPRSYIAKAGSGEANRRPRQVTHEVAIHDGRAVADRVTLDGEGFALVGHRSRVRDFYDADEVKRVYYPEVERLVREATGAARVVVFDHNVRNKTRAERKTDGARLPVTFVHNDYTPKSGPQRVRDLLPAAEAEELIKHRFAVINVWRPIRGPVLDTPLAFCDAKSMGPGDFVPTDLVYDNRVGEVYSVCHNPEHRWYYVPEMRADEAILLKCYDSAADGRARFTAHSAFEHPAAPADAAPRESIEVRTLVFFPPEG